MPAIAPVAPHTGFEPLTLRGPTGGDIAAHVLAAISRASSVVDTHQSAAVPSQLSLKGLLQSENVQMVSIPPISSPQVANVVLTPNAQIQENLAALARFADHLPLDVDAAAPRVSNDELLIMGNLVRDISASLEKIESLRADEDEVLPFVADKYVPMRPMSSIARRRRKEKKKLKIAHKCHSCKRLDTPQWRPGPDGPRTLCNVCGLIYTKRQQRQAEQVMRPSRDE
ncbi:transcription factor rfeH-Penicillium chrysogenum [Cordyceps fumosorosea ARSEF 2679]|uniref:Transcription factor rfeH-Penicillium chrysogenum n=1 Tax=Cordyceps fumosorosea (strain ARSEF 2679) TaxID=1081104 RepID=A0A167Q4Q3_CORFA|nr:transcription factor rfeH-Penicillium chrysogenum [Cordyceps fumosorosea ARSEF 2679]OAA57286.1 transcription factor rfeH-Penicillium chrysogenum [Cordyceps fumosorosea ARSEF 2679]